MDACEGEGESMADCAQFCGDNERLFKAAGAETVEDALASIAAARAVLDGGMVGDDSPQYTDIELRVGRKGAGMSDTVDDRFGLFRSFIRHRAYLADVMGRVARAVEQRAQIHDLSKLQDDEFEGFSRIHAAARIHKFGSPEYAEGLRQERPTIDLHFSRNRHHPERPKLMGEAAEVGRGMPDDYTYWAARDGAAMNFLDVIEMVCDWWAASKGYDDARPWSETVKLNLAQKEKYLSSEQLWLARDVAAWLAVKAPSNG